MVEQTVAGTLNWDDPAQDFGISTTFTIAEYEVACDNAWEAGVMWAIEKLYDMERRFSDMGLTPKRADVYKELFNHIITTMDAKLDAVRDERKIIRLEELIRKLEKKIQA